MLGSDHGVEFTLPAWCDRFLGRQFATEPTPHDWLSYSEQYFLSATAGAVFRDDIGDLTALRERLAYFPRDVWLYKLAVQWGRIAEERAYVGRTGQVGDELGSPVVAARMVGNIMRLALLIERRYAPYLRRDHGLHCADERGLGRAATPGPRGSIAPGSLSGGLDWNSVRGIAAIAAAACLTAAIIV